MAEAPGNSTSSSLIHWIETQAGFLARIEALVIVAAVLLTVLAGLGAYRRCSTSSVMKLTLWTTYTLSTILVAYAIGLMQSASFSNELFLLWVSFLVVVLASPSSITTYSLDDNKRWKRQIAQQTVQMLYLGSIFNAYVKASRFWMPGWILAIVIAAKLGQKFQSIGIASFTAEGMAVHNILVAGYMRYEHQQDGGEEIDPVNMRGYKYLVAGEEGEDIRGTAAGYKTRLKISPTVITTDKVWRCEGQLLSYANDPDGRLKDTCLSFALFKLLRRRFAGYDMAESRHTKTRDLVIRGLLVSRDGRHDCERAFRVIEVELAFLYDFFYTKYPFLYAYQFVWGHFFALFDMILRSIFLFVGCCWVAFLLIRYQPRDKDYHLGGADIAVTYVVVLALIALEVFEIIDYAFSDWAKVQLLCKYVEKRSWQKNECVTKLLGFVCRRRIWKPWSNKIGQYSLLQSFDYNPSFLKSKLGLFFPDDYKKGKQASDPIALPGEVKKAIARSLRASNGILSNGESSLQQNGLGRNFSWACKFDTTTEAILVWHVATAMCEISSNQHNGIPSQNFMDDRVVARSLSEYCAYLLIFVPQLLPDPTYNTSRIFDIIVSEASEFLHESLLPDRILEKMMNVVEPTETVWKKGAKLGKQLIREIRDDGLRWKVLAEFWAELTLYLAPSSNATAHAERLAEGGEFITHLWALLTHAGVLQRPPII